MAKNATNAGKKYIIQWNGKRNNWKYKLVIIPSYNDTNYASLTDTNENYSCLLDFEYIPFEFDKYNIGMSAAPSLKLDFNLGLCSANLANVLCDPFTTFDRVTTFNTDSIFPCHELFTTGNVFELYIDFRLEETENYVLQYRGTQITSIEQYDNENKVLTVETESITKTIMGQIKFDNFLFLHCHYTQNGSSQAVPNTTITSKLEVFVKKHFEFDVLNYTRLTRSGDYVFYFDKLEKVYEGMEYLCSLLFKKIMRKSSYETFTINRLWNDFYKVTENIDGTGSRGSVLLDGELLIAAHINTFALSTQSSFDNIGSADGFIYGLGNEYESMWDFFADLAGSYCQKSIGLIQGLYVGQMLNTVEKIVDLRQIHDCKLTFFADVASKFSISASEDHEGKSDTIEVNIIGTRSSEAVEFQQPLHSVPFVGDYSINVAGDDSVYTFTKMPNLCVWYDNATDYVPVHPRNKIDLGNSIDSDAYNTVNATTTIKPALDDYGVNAQITNFDNKYGSYYVTAQTMSYFFSDNYQTKIECKVFAEYLQDEVLGTAYSPFLLPTLNRFTIDLSTLEPATGVFSEIPTKYEIISSKFTKENEMCEITLLSRRV